MIFKTRKCFEEVVYNKYYDKYNVFKKRLL